LGVILRVLITGSNGFIGKNLKARLIECENVEILIFNRDDKLDSLSSKLEDVDYVFHFAGINRSENEKDYLNANIDLTQLICQKLIDIKKKSGINIPIIFTSSIQIYLDNIYGKTKKRAEEIIRNLQSNYGIPAYILRLPNVFGKWCKPNYNSVVANFCYNIAHNLEIKISDKNKKITLLYIDDLVDIFIKIIKTDHFHENIESTLFSDKNERLIQLPELYDITLGELASIILSFKNCRENLLMNKVGTGLFRALYSTYISYLPKESFAYSVPSYKDSRGSFVEMLKTIDSGQFSYFTAHPGVTRGGHYHHSKSEKFLVVKGSALFKFKHIISNDSYEIAISEYDFKIVDTIPGWAHDITNTGSDDLIVLLWANELFDKDNPDTYKSNL
jgi:UDP-2-acetamido-2,6-beta-L-arabino-hexul-4-ose reductase